MAYKVSIYKMLKHISRQSRYRHLREEIRRIQSRMHGCSDCAFAQETGRRCPAPMLQHEESLHALSMYLTDKKRLVNSALETSIRSRRRRKERSLQSMDDLKCVTHPDVWLRNCAPTSETRQQRSGVSSVFKLSEIDRHHRHKT